MGDTDAAMDKPSKDSPNNNKPKSAAAAAAAGLQDPKRDGKSDTHKSPSKKRRKVNHGTSSPVRSSPV